MNTFDEPKQCETPLPAPADGRWRNALNEPPLTVGQFWVILREGGKDTRRYGMAHCFYQYPQPHEQVVKWDSANGEQWSVEYWMPIIPLPNGI